MVEDSSELRAIMRSGDTPTLPQALNMPLEHVDRYKCVASATKAVCKSK